MILFFYGTDSYRIFQQVKKIKEKFISASLGDTNLVILSAKETAFDEFARQVLAMPFLSKTRLVVVENILSEGNKALQEKVGEYLNKIPKTTVLVFSESKPDKRLSLYKKLIKADKVQEFAPLEDDYLRKYIKKEIETQGGSIEPNAINKLVEYVGSDLWRMSNEIDKLIAYNKQITTKNIDLLVKSKVESDVFALIDAIGQKNLKKALFEYQKLLDSGENELYILSMIVYQYRNMLILKDLTERENNNSPYQLAKISGVHPYVAQKIVPQLRNFDLCELKKSYRTLLNFDIALKTGKMENRAGLTLLIIKLVK